MNHKNCSNCLVYDEVIDGVLTPCDEEAALNKHYCTAYKTGIPDKIWKGQSACQEKINRS